MKTVSLPRRHLLRAAGLGCASIALPPLEAMISGGIGHRKAHAASPLRLMTFFWPNGAYMGGFTPTSTGPDYQLPVCLEPFAPVKSKLLVLTGIKNQGSLTGEGGSHEKGRVCFSTGVPSLSGQSAGGPSIDQVAAKAIGDQTMLRSLVIAPGEAQGGNSQYFSWAAAGEPVQPELKPAALFDKLFGGGVSGGNGIDLATVRRKRRSILDFVAGDVQRLERRLGLDDKRRLDAHLGAVRDIERRIMREEQSAATCASKPPAPPADPKDDPWQWIYNGYPLERYQLLVDLMVTAVQCDLTRIVNLTLNNIDINSWIYKTYGDTRAHHDISHDTAAGEIHKGYTRYQMGFLADLMTRLDNIPEGEGSVLDNTVIYASSEISDGGAHNFTNMPVLVGGGGGKRLRTGQHINLMKFLEPGRSANTKDDEWTDLGKLFLTMLKVVGVTGVDRWGAATSSLAQIEA